MSAISTKPNVRFIGRRSSYFRTSGFDGHSVDNGLIVTNYRHIKDHSEKLDLTDKRQLREYARNREEFEHADNSDGRDASTRGHVVCGGRGHGAGTSLSRADNSVGHRHWRRSSLDAGHSRELQEGTSGQ